MASRVRKLQKECCGAQIISFGSGSPEPQIRIAALAPAPAPALINFIRYLTVTFFCLEYQYFLHGLMNVVPRYD
jgi:hypothetical protein